MPNGIADQDGPIWARVAVPFAGGNRGAFFIPDVGDEVVVAFLGGDPRCAIVLGSLWNGQDTAPETIGGSGQSVDRWTITGKAGTRIAIVEQPASSATITFSTPGGLTGTLTDRGRLDRIQPIRTERRCAIDSSGVTINAPTGEVQITAASQVTVTAPSVTVNAAMSTFSGMVQCQTLLATTVDAATYTLGAGNVW